MKNDYYWGALVLDSIDLFIKSNLNKSDYLIFLLFCKELNPETNIANLNQKNIISLLKENYNYQITKGTVSKSINKLLDNQFISKAHKRQGFMVNPNLFYQESNFFLPDKQHVFDESLRSNGESPKFYLDTQDKGIISLEEIGNSFEGNDDY